MSRYNYSKLKGRIIEKYNTQDNFAKALNKPPQRISGVLNNKFTLDQDEVTKWAECLEIPLDQYGIFFFAYEVHESE